MTPVEPQYCGLHEVYERWNENRWEEQTRKNEVLFKLCDNLASEIVGIKLFMTKISIFLVVAMSLVQFFAPVIWKLLGVK